MLRTTVQSIYITVIVNALLSDGKSGFERPKLTNKLETIWQEINDNNYSLSEIHGGLFNRLDDTDDVWSYFYTNYRKADNEKPSVRLLQYAPKPFHQGMQDVLDRNFWIGTNRTNVIFDTLKKFFLQAIYTVRYKMLIMQELRRLMVDKLEYKVGFAMSKAYYSFKQSSTMYAVMIDKFASVDNIYVITTLLHMNEKIIHIQYDTELIADYIFTLFDEKTELAKNAKQNKLKG